ncbi:MAG: hypothetical protein IJT84_05315 [Clostridia bacterium]|nr:hypothetical protein [Clostridia bacterium]
MLETNEDLTLDTLTESDKQKLLFEQQKKTLDLFLERRAITKDQYDLSLNTLIEKMGI